MLTEEQRIEIQQEVARLFRRLVSRASLKEDELPDQPIRILPGLERSSFPLPSLESLKTDAAFERIRAQLAAVCAGPQTLQMQAVEPLVRVIARAVEVLGSSEKALRWINAPVRSLGDQTPVSLLSSPEGIERVEDALGSIEHGVW